jgi:hypothetical protein
MSYDTERVLQQVRSQRECQDQLLGEQDRPPIAWVGKMLEEVGSIARSAGCGTHILERDYRFEMLGIAVLAVAAIECYDRNLEKEKYE